MGKQVVHFEIIGKDGKRLQDFYSQLFGWKIDANNPMNYGMVRPDDAGMGGGMG
jgi:predicted enzyme related to lactoylglutathione lyase